MSKLTPNGSKLPSLAHGLSLLSYNVLLPNSSDGWWVYKYYSTTIPEEHRTWEFRKGLLKEQISAYDADVVCIQEASADSFESDFDFMKGLGYDHILHTKYRFRSATFWKTGKHELDGVFHKDRTLVTGLREVGKGGLVWVINCHLTAGPCPADRLRQVHDGVETVRKHLAKLKHTPADARLIVCGDFNSCGGLHGETQNSTAVGHLLLNGEVAPEFTEISYPDVKITSKAKKNAFAPLKDAYSEIYESESGNTRPPTYLAKELVSTFRDSDGKMKPEFVEAIRKMYNQYVTEGGFMDMEGVEKWLVTINRAYGRGSEYRAAVAAMEKSGVKGLSFEEFLSIYGAELEEGKYWGVEHDMATCGVGLAGAFEGIFAAAFDYIFYTPRTMRLHAVLEPITAERKGLVDLGDYPPNSWHPSDHLPIGAVLEFVDYVAQY